MDVDKSSPANIKLLQHLLRVKGLPGLESMPPRHGWESFTETSTHPDVGERLWDKLNGILPRDCRWIVNGAPVLMQPQTGIVFAVALGTKYCLRIPKALIAEAVQLGAPRVTKWASGAELNVEEVFGPNWIFGAWLEKEEDWCLASFEQLRKPVF